MLIDPVATEYGKLIAYYLQITDSCSGAEWWLNFGKSRSSLGGSEARTAMYMCAGSSVLNHQLSSYIAIITSLVSSVCADTYFTYCTAGDAGAALVGHRVIEWPSRIRGVRYVRIYTFVLYEYSMVHYMPSLGMWWTNLITNCTSYEYSHLTVLVGGRRYSVRVPGYLFLLFQIL